MPEGTDAAAGATSAGRWRFWGRWVAANAVAELIGLGSVAALGILFVSRLGEPHGLMPSLGFAAAFTALGAIEGAVVGWAQARVLRSRWPALRGWTAATSVGAVVAWALGMLPSTLMNIGEPAAGAAAAAPPQIGPGLQLLLAAGLGFAAGPVLAIFQWRRLREWLPRGALWWLPANGAAWALGMPVVFAGVHAAVHAPSRTLAIGAAALSLLAAGAVVGAVHGAVLVRLMIRPFNGRPSAETASGFAEPGDR